jgi:hypothetical protein
MRVAYFHGEIVNWMEMKNKNENEHLNEIRVNLSSFEYKQRFAIKNNIFSPML